MKKHNIIIITLDGLRRDRINLMHSLKEFNSNNLFFSNIITAAPYTVASMHTLFSGIYPTVNGVNGYYNMFRFRKELCKTMAQYLQEQGYYIFGDLVNDCSIPTQGFNKFTVHDEFNDDLISRHKNLVSELAKKEQFLLYLHYSNIHTECIKHVGKVYDDFSEEFFNNLERNKQRYNSSLISADKYFGAIISHIKDLGIYDDTIVVVLSDHGASNGERVGEKMYGSYLYNYTINTFITFHIPKQMPTEVSLQGRTIDFLPTMLEILDIKIDDTYESIQGKSLMSFVRNEEITDRTAFCETGGLGGPYPSPKEHNVFALIKNKKKLIYNNTPNTWELYDLEEDLNEENNIVDSSWEEATLLKKELLGQMSLNKKRAQPYNIKI